MERDISMDFIWSAADREPPTKPAYTVSSSGTAENTFIRLTEIVLGNALGLFLWLKD